jgi:hypothetical protein
MKKLKHSKYKNTGILFEMLVRKLTSETMTSNKTQTLDIIKKYFGKNTELSKELQLYNQLVKEQHKSEARALEFIRTTRDAHSQLNQGLLRRQKYNLVKEISEKFSFDSLSKGHINNYKALASAYMLFEYKDSDNIKQLTECKNVVLENSIISKKQSRPINEISKVLSAQEKDTRLLAYKIMIDKFNEKYVSLTESQKRLLNKYITNVNDTDALKGYVKQIIPGIKKHLAEHAKKVTDTVTRIKVQKLSEMLCNVENMKTIKESHVLSLMRYMDLIDELTEVHQ